MEQATARAHPNIAFIKYWGNKDSALRLPENTTLSMNLDGIFTQTTVRWDAEQASDVLTINNKSAAPAALERVSAHLDLIRQRANFNYRAAVASENNFPMGAGIASSASAFAALTLAAASAARLELPERELTTIARMGSGSAARSVPAGFVEWHYAQTSEDAYAESFAPPDYWDLVDVIAVVSAEHKAVGSQQGHESAATSDLQAARIAGAQARARLCKQAILERDFLAFAEVVEHDSNLMHAIMMTSRPPLFYWLPPTLTIMAQVRAWRNDGLNVCYTLDAGPNVHCICLAKDAPAVAQQLKALEGVQEVLSARPGGAACIMA